MRLPYHYRYLPDSLFGQAGFRPNKIRVPDFIHSSISSNPKLEICSCGLIAVSILGNRGHRDHTTGLANPNAITAHVQRFDADSVEPVSKLIFECSCGHLLLHRNESDGAIALADLPQHKCIPRGSGPIERDSLARTLRDFYLDRFIEWRGVEYRIGVDHGQSDFETESHDLDGLLIFFAHVDLRNVIEDAIPTHSWLKENIEFVLHKWPGQKRDTYGVIVHSSEHIIRMRMLLEVALLSLGQDGFFVYSRGGLKQYAVLTPEYRLREARKTFV